MAIKDEPEMLGMQVNLDDCCCSSLIGNCPTNKGFHTIKKSTAKEANAKTMLYIDARHEAQQKKCSTVTSFDALFQRGWPIFKQA